MPNLVQLVRFGSAIGSIVGMSWHNDWVTRSDSSIPAKNSL